VGTTDLALFVHSSPPLPRVRVKAEVLSAEPRYHRPWYPPFENREGWGNLSVGNGAS